MSTVDFYIVQHDTAPALTRQLLDSTGTAVNLTGASVVFNMKRGTTTVISRATASITAAASGTVAYRWAAGDTAAVGTYDGEFEVTFADGTIQTFPNPRKIRIQITGDLG